MFKKKEKKEVIKDELVPEVSVDSPEGIFMQVDELLKLENAANQQKFLELEIRNKEQVIQNINLQMDIFNRDLLQQKNLIQELSMRHKNANVACKGIVDGLKKKYGLDEKDDFAYNPETCEINPKE